MDDPGLSPRRLEELLQLVLLP